MKKGIISMSIVYTFLVLFILIMTGIMSAFLVRSSMVDAVIEEAKEEIYVYW